MAKKIHTKQNQKRKSARKGLKVVSPYLRIYFVSFFVGIVVYLGGTYLIKPQPPCANSHSCSSDLNVKIENGALGMFQGHVVKPPTINLADIGVGQSVLGLKVPSSEKHIFVDLSTQTLYAMQGTTQIMQALVASGRWHPTPVGNFHIWQKLISTRMSGGEGLDAYDLPNVPYVMYFYNDFGLHGSYWHDNYGHTMSHGCVNMRPIDAQALYNWADGPTNGQLGTAVSICEHLTSPGTCLQTNPVQ